VSKDERVIPVSVITGFLGSGKTTLLARLLREPSMGRTAVIMNEFGAMGLDHELLETSDESFVTLSNGCLCCRVRSDLVLTLGDLAARRAAGTVPPFDRAVIETSGLADPAPILHALMTDAALREVYALDNVVATVDAITGLATFSSHAESRRQAALADTVVITKTDVPEADADAVSEQLAMINPGARRLTVVHGDIPPAELFASRFYDVSARAPEPQSWLADNALASIGAHDQREITTFCIVRTEPIRAVTLALFLSALADNCGAELLRMKGIVNVAEHPHAPAVIHGVQHVFSAPQWLERWPSDDRRTRLVFIGRRIPESWVRRLLDLLDAEVQKEIARRAS
jgi:G3E family GTPase